MDCSNCGDEIQAPPAVPALGAAGGWCAPSETVYDLPNPPPMCPDCRARFMFVAEFGFDPGRDGENLRVPRGGIQYGIPAPPADHVWPEEDD